jgi:hypothetical protein
VGQVLITSGRGGLISQPADAVVDYILDWSRWLRGDTIAVSAVTPPAGLTVSVPATDTTTTTIRVGPANSGTYHEIAASIITATGQHWTDIVRVRIAKAYAPAPV